jgi:uncharacterized damage-inducible protein DinB
MKRVIPFLVLACLIAIPVLAQPPAAQAPAASAAPADPLSRTFKTGFDTITRYLAGSADKMPEADFAFKPTPEVRSFGQILGHVANSHYGYCANVKGEKNPNAGNDFEKVTVKADLVKALTDSIAYCAAVYGSMTDARFLETVKMGQNEVIRGRTLMQNLTHDWEHYGNLVTYLRLKGIVPPSSEPKK